MGAVYNWCFTFLDDRSDPWHLGQNFGPVPADAGFADWRFPFVGCGKMGFKGLVAQGLFNHKRKMCKESLQL